MVLHILCFFLVVCSGSWLSYVTTRLVSPNSQKTFLTETLYINLYVIIILIFVAELPFLYIINRLVSQSLQFQRDSEAIKVEQVQSVHETASLHEEQENRDDSIIERALAVDEETDSKFE